MRKYFREWKFKFNFAKRLFIIQIWSIMKEKSKVAFTPEYVESLEEGQVFVFGSNLIGCHSGGASMTAMNNFGAVWGQAEGPQGQCYAIPVDIRGEAVDNVSSYMKRHIDKFLDYAKEHKVLFFLVPRVGCGAAGFDDEFMAPFFRDALYINNVSLPKSFVEILKRKETGESIQKVYNLIILDESGSMQSIEKQAVSGLNETFLTIRNAQKEHQEQQHYITFVTFNSARIRTVIDRLPVDSSKELKWTDYAPGACTPLFDAMGRSINELKSFVEDEAVVLVTIITDGYENASKEYNGIAIKELVGELKKKGWLFAYIGTNQDVDAIADRLGIRSRMNYEYSPEGTADMFRTESHSKREFYKRLHQMGRSFMMEDNYDYFNPNDVDSRKSEDEPEKEPDITWDLNEDQSLPQNDDNQEEESKGLWDKVKSILKS